MNCRQVHENIEAYYEGALPALDERGVDIHLVQCPACNEELGGVGAMVGICHEAFDEATPESDIGGLKSGIAELARRVEQQSIRRGDFNRKDLLMRATFALVIIPAIYLFGFAAFQTYTAITEVMPTNSQQMKVMDANSDPLDSPIKPW